VKRARLGSEVGRPAAPLFGDLRHLGIGSRRRFGSGKILRNPFFVNRPVLAHAIFRGRFRQFSSRHHQHFLPIIVVGFKILRRASRDTAHRPALRSAAT
jgi:hypothetical protein